MEIKRGGAGRRPTLGAVYLGGDGGGTMTLKYAKLNSADREVTMSRETPISTVSIPRPHRTKIRGIDALLRYNSSTFCQH